MNNIWKKIGLAMVVMITSSQSWSSVLIEPYGGYQFSVGGKYGSEDTSFSGWGFGGRLGLDLNRIMFGIDYDWMNFDTEFESGGKVETDQTNFGGLVGFNPAGTGFRFWFEYFFDVENTYKFSGGNSKFSGNGWGLGFGYKVTDIVALNAEYRNWTLDETSDGTPISDITGSAILLTISFPFEILK